MKSLAEKFECRTIPEPNSGCLLWLGSVAGKFGRQYARLTVDDRMRQASHIALELAGRPLPEGMCACHRCDNTLCVNADHLFAGTQKDNIEDMMAKGRQNLSGFQEERDRHRISDEERQPARDMFDKGFGIIATARATNTNRSNVQNWFRKWGRVPRSYTRKSA